MVIFSLFHESVLHFVQQGGTRFEKISVLRFDIINEAHLYIKSSAIPYTN